MKIVFVVDNYSSKTDGTNISANRFKAELEKLGHTVSILSIGIEGKNMHALKERRIPIVSRVSAKSNMKFAKFDREVAKQAFEGADVVHFFFPWKMERQCLALANEMNIATTAAFHCHPENIIRNAGLTKSKPIEDTLFAVWRDTFYNKVDNIHCPSKFTADELIKHGYKGRLHVISNGVLDVFKPAEKPLKRTDDKINILMIGRLAPEKRQDLVIEATKLSKYKDRIQLYFAGQGAHLERYQELGKNLPNPPQFKFLSQPELLELLHKTDVYVHAADVEIEGISCIEAIACGIVPVISNSKKAATSQFAIDDRSIFEAGSAESLKTKLEWLIEHPEERKALAAKYAALGESYRIKNSVRRMEYMLQSAVKDYRVMFERVRIPEGAFSSAHSEYQDAIQDEHLYADEYSQYLKAR